jgi:hypothetical protein
MSPRYPHGDPDAAPERSPFVCIQSAVQPEFTLCGDAFDLCKGDDTDALTPNVAQPGDLITCPNCRKQIAACKTVKRWRAANGSGDA